MLSSVCKSLTDSKSSERYSLQSHVINDRCDQRLRGSRHNALECSLFHYIIHQWNNVLTVAATACEETVFVCVQL